MSQSYKKNKKKLCIENKEKKEYNGFMKVQALNRSTIKNTRLHNLLVEKSKTSLAKKLYKNSSNSLVRSIYKFSKLMIETSSII